MQKSISCLAGAIIVCAGASARADLAGLVVAVADGDTLTVLDEERHEHRIRLRGIDAPERKQPYGHRSKEALSDCAFHHHVLVEGSKLDRYGRVIGKVVSSGVDCNLRQIRLGLAWHYKQFEREQSKPDRVEYAQAEERARYGHTGLWAGPSPEPPWEYRRSGNR